MCNIVRVVLLFALLTLPSALAAREETGPDPAHRKACHHYDNRARFLPRDHAPALVVVLADSCLAALSSLSSRATPPAELERARTFLDRLVAFKSMVITINMERVFGPDPGPRDRLRFPEARPLTATGEYLIAREMGVLHAWRDWIAIGPDFAGPMLPRR